MWAILVLLIVIAAAAWVGVRGLQAKQQLDGAMPLVTKLKAQVLAQDTAGAKATYAQLAPRAAKAASLTSDPVWRVAELVPGVGANLSVTRTLAAQTDAVVTGAIRPLVDVSGRLSLESLKPKDGRIDVAALTALRGPVSEASATVDSALSQVKKVDTAGAIGQVASAKTKLVTMLTPVAAQLGEANSLLSIVPKVLGVDKPRNYLLAFQNNGEIMPGGGTIGSMAILHVENGSIQLTQQASAADTDFPRFGTPPLTIPAELSALYPNTLGYYIQNLTETPRFSESYAVAKAMWKQQKGVEIDGMVAVDIVALSQFLAVTGPIGLPDGTQLTSANAAAGGQNMTEALLQYEGLLVERTIAEKLEESAHSLLDRARISASKQHIFLATFVPPVLPTDSLYPERGHSLLVSFFCFLVIWSSSALLIAGIRDQRM